MTPDLRAAREILRCFALPGPIERCDALGGGHINASFLVSAAGADGPSEFVLQRVNPEVFPDASAVMHNITHVTRHLAVHARRTWGGEWRRHALELIATKAGDAWHAAEDGSGWRLYRYIAGARTHERAGSPRQAEAAARAFGTFLRFVADYGGPPLRETIPGFHDTAARFAALDQAATRDAAGRAGTCAPEIRAAIAGRSLAKVLPALLADGSVPTRVTHNDAKIANVLYDAASDEALCVIDFDTVMPGSALYDFGDLVRSMVSGTSEDEPDLSCVAADPRVFEAIVRGYVAGAADALTPAERALLVFAGRLLAVEQAVRFLTDHLEGDRYYRVRHPGHNLQRARVQLQLFASLSAQERELSRIAANCSSGRDTR